MGRAQSKIALLALVAALSLGLLSCAAQGAAPENVRAQVTLAPAASYEHATVVRVVDGDTLVVRLDGGEANSTRLIGVDAPESVNPDESKNTEEGAACSEYVKALVPEGAEVWLERDVSDVDAYGRWLRYVWLSDPAGEGASFGGSTLNAHLVSYGYARAKDYEPDTAHSDLLHDLARETPADAAPLGPVKGAGQGA